QEFRAGRRHVPFGVRSKLAPYANPIQDCQMLETTRCRLPHGLTYSSRRTRPPGLTTRPSPQSAGTCSGSGSPQNRKLVTAASKKPAGTASAVHPFGSAARLLQKGEGGRVRSSPAGLVSMPDTIAPAG